MPKTRAVTDSQAKQIIELIGEPELALFFITWMGNGLNATQAYKELHPDVTQGSAEVLGHRWLSRVKPQVLLGVYKLGPDRYFKQLDEGLNATKWNDFTGEREPDHATRRPYHDKLGRILGIEQTGPSTLIQNNGEMTLEFSGGNEGKTP